MNSIADAASDRLAVLVADDDPIFRQIVETRLTRADCTVLHATDGGEAWRLIRAQRIDLAIVDFEMPGLDGVALIRCLRGHPLTRHIPIVMCTSREDMTAVRAAMDAGASTYFSKPLNWVAFDHQTGHLLNLAHMSRRTQRLESLLAAKDAEIGRLLADLDEFIAEAGAQGMGAAVPALRAMRERFPAACRAATGQARAAGDDPRELVPVRRTSA